MNAEVVAFAKRPDVSNIAVPGETIIWDGWLFDAVTVCEFTPYGLLDEIPGATQATAQEWWDILVDRWPGAALDVVRRLRLAGHGSEEIRTGHSLCVFNEPPAKTKSRKVGTRKGLPDRPKDGATSRALLELASTLDVEALGNLIDKLIGFLQAKYDVVHP